MRKTYILTPGPTPIPETVRAVATLPLLHHRTPEFSELFTEVRSGLKTIFKTENDVLMLACTGTGAMDAAISNLFSPGDQVITINAGKFGARWGKIAKSYGLEAFEITLKRGAAFDLSSLPSAIKNHPKAKAVLFQATETSTGLELPTREICQIARSASMLSVCDGITAVGVYDLPMDQWQIDVLISGSQKAFMIPPGLAFVALSPIAWSHSKESKLPHFYFDLLKEKEAQNKNQTAWTPATSQIMGLHESLKMIHSEGLAKCYERHDLLAKATRAGVKALGLELLSPDSPSRAVTAVKVPSSVKEGKKIPKLMREKYGVTIAGGQDELEGQIFRLSHFGYAGLFDVTTGLSALELVLHELGQPVRFGAAVGAALETYYQGQQSKEHS